MWGEGGGGERRVQYGKKCVHIVRYRGGSSITDLSGSAKLRLSISNNS